MMLLRASLLAILALQAATVASAAPIVADKTIELAQASESTARKGTRNYRPGESAATTTDSAQKQSDTVGSQDKLAQCMETWDAGTHITKSKWREICQRQLNDR